MVPYLSPMVLRKEVESLISQDGMKILEKEGLVRERPIIYWNLVWYFSRLNLPTYLPLLNLWDFRRKSQDLQKVSGRGWLRGGGGVCGVVNTMCIIMYMYNTCYMTQYSPLYMHIHVRT